MHLSSNPSVLREAGRFSSLLCLKQPGVELDPRETLHMTIWVVVLWTYCYLSVALWKCDIHHWIPKQHMSMLHDTINHSNLNGCFRFWKFGHKKSAMLWKCIICMYVTSWVFCENFFFWLFTKYYLSARLILFLNLLKTSISGWVT